MTSKQYISALWVLWLVLLLALCGIIEWQRPECPAGATSSYSNGWHCEVPYLERR